MAEMIGEAGISFYPAGGHNHDGITSSRIDSTKYSVWDWEWDIITFAPPSRLGRQFLNYISFTRSVIDIVNQGVLQPAGIILQPGALHGSSITAETIEATQIAANTITADEIEAGTITGNLFNANVVLVNQVIRSNNYSPGVSGWAINGNGDAEFANTAIRGTVTAGNVQIGADDFWDSSGNFKLGGNTGIYTNGPNIVIGSSIIVDGDVQVSNIYIDNLNFWEPGIFQVGVDNNNYIAFNNNVLEMTGVIVARAGSIGNWIINGSKLIGSSNNASTIVLDAAGTGSIYAGNTLSITNDDIFAEDITGLDRVRSGSYLSNTHTEMQFPGVFYTHAAQNVFGRDNFGWAFTYDPGTGNVWAHMWDQSANGGVGAYTISKCLSNCGQTTSTTTLGTTTTTTTSPGGGDGGGGTTPPATTPPATTPPATTEPPTTEPPTSCIPPCPPGFFCITESNLCIG